MVLPVRMEQATIARQLAKIRYTLKTTLSIRLDEF